MTCKNSFKDTKKKLGMVVLVPSIPAAIGEVGGPAEVRGQVWSVNSMPAKAKS